MNKLKRTCENCTLAKVKCQGQPVCHRCSKRGLECIFRKQRKRGRKSHYASNFEKRETPTATETYAPIALQHSPQHVSMARPHSQTLPSTQVLPVPPSYGQVFSYFDPQGQPGHYTTQSFGEQPPTAFAGGNLYGVQPQPIFQMGDSSQLPNQFFYVPQQPLQQTYFNQSSASGLPPRILGTQPNPSQSTFMETSRHSKIITTSEAVKTKLPKFEKLRIESFLDINYEKLKSTKNKDLNEIEKLKLYICRIVDLLAAYESGDAPKILKKWMEQQLNRAYEPTKDTIPNKIIFKTTPRLNSGIDALLLHSIRVSREWNNTIPGIFISYTGANQRLKVEMNQTCKICFDFAHDFVEKPFLSFGGDVLALILSRSEDLTELLSTLKFKSKMKRRRDNIRFTSMHLVECIWRDRQMRCSALPTLVRCAVLQKQDADGNTYTEVVYSFENIAIANQSESKSYGFDVKMNQKVDEQSETSWMARIMERLT